ncbi:hypothetical protein L2E82_26103 [Cichorium intybus]|uniref:Uncharacterized protein n=1 Tax=Cichorium intybus TaxID=13427 RepID=A0ACB9E6B3_CICIN|nr:hypothetical protein L2E82_26103 [Cichorium intybus]
MVDPQLKLTGHSTKLDHSAILNLQCGAALVHLLGLLLLLSHFACILMELSYPNPSKIIKLYCIVVHCTSAPIKYKYARYGNPNYKNR